MTMGRRYLAEFVGTFGIVFPPVALAATGEGGLVGAALVSGLAVLTMIYALGPICAAHFNPAVTLAFAAIRRFPGRYVAPYIGSQLAGAVAAALLARLLFGAASGAHVPAAPEAVVRNLGMEITISFFLMLVIAAVATDRRVSAPVPGLAIGLVVVTNVLLAGPVTGGSMNPARSFGPAIVTGGAAASHYWIYLIGPIVGAALGAVAYEAMRLDRASACGAPHDLLETAP
ncbi:MAG: MIP/aquaporin family protein [Fimbriimonas sp.]